MAFGNYTVGTLMVVREMTELCWVEWERSSVYSKTFWKRSASTHAARACMRFLCHCVKYTFGIGYSSCQNLLSLESTKSADYIYILSISIKSI